MSLSVIQQIGAIVTGLLGLLAIFSPSLIERFVSIRASGKLGVSEIRATYGGFFLGLAIFALYSQEQIAYFALGFAWLGAAIVRMFTLFFGCYSAKNFGGVIFESVIGLLCLSSLVI